MPAFEVENRTPASVGFQLAGDFGRLRRVFEARAGEGARIRRGRASKARLEAQLSPRASAKWIVRDSAARHVGTGLGRSCSISRRISVNSALLLRAQRGRIDDVKRMRSAPSLVWVKRSPLMSLTTTEWRQERS